MTRNTRIGLLLAAAVVLVAAVVIIGNGGSDKKESSTAAQSTSATGGQGSTAAPAPIKVIQIRNGRPVGGIQKVVANKGDRIRFKVHSDAAHDIHVHGFN